MRTTPLALALLLALRAGALSATQTAAPQATPPDKPAAQGAATPAVSQAPTFPAQVEQVVVDLVVTDKKGNAVRGLRQEDMTVLEDGVPQQVTSFEAVTLPEAPPAASNAPLPRVSINTDPAEQRGRTFVIVFDDTHLTPARANQAKAAVASFLEKGTREGDRITLVSTAGGTWWTTRMESGRPKLLDLLKRFDGRYIPDTSMDRMSEYEAMRIYEFHDPDVTLRVLRRWDAYGVNLSGQSGTQATKTVSTQGSSASPDDPMVSGKASEVYYQAVTRIRTTMELLQRVINGLAPAKGRKSVILVSEGFIYDVNLDEYRRVNEASRRANAAIYFLNARGLEAMPMEMTAQFGPAIPDQDVGALFSETIDATAGSDEIASDSGGFVVRNTNDLGQGIERIARETQAYYLLGYVSRNTARDGKFRKIQVKLADAKGLTVHARKGYYAPSDTAKPPDVKKGVDPVIQAAVDSPWAQDGIPLRMTDFVGDERGLGKAEVLVATEVDIRSLQFEEKEGRNLGELQFMLVVAHRESGEFFRYDQSVNMKLLPATRERLLQTWYPIVRDFELKPGDYQAKIVVRDTHSGRVGSVMHEFEVPALDSFRVSTPLVGDGRVKGPGGELGGPPVIVRREFAAGADVFCSFEVYGAKTDAKDGMPRVQHGYEVRRPDGSVFTAVAPSLIKPTSLGHLSRMFGFRLADAPPGDYQIRMTLRDEIAGRALEWTEPFTVVPATAAPAVAAPAASAPAAAPAPATGGR
ncbi:MAG TPA: VWA domain-containing protein [Vicinamibacteria bacterium]|nr:VWA domain-containing protein [Vicinamibacteria bacterium]